MTKRELELLQSAMIPHSDGDTYEAVDWQDEDFEEEVYESLKASGYIEDVGRGFVRITSEGVEAYAAAVPDGNIARL